MWWTLGLIAVLIWLWWLSSTYLLYLYEAANGTVLALLRQRGSPAALLLRALCWSLYSHALVILGGISGLWRRWWSLPPGPSRRVPVVFVHGLYHNRTAWFLYRRWFRRWGWSHAHAFSLGRPFSPIEKHAERLQAEVGRVLESTGASQVDLVGHSMGGLVIRQCLAAGEGRGRVRRVVTLATPHQGSKLAVFALGEAGRQMRPGSDFLKKLSQEEMAVEKIYAIYTLLDNMVLPATAAKLDGKAVECLETEAIDHLGLLYCRRTALLVRKCLE